MGSTNYYLIFFYSIFFFLTSCKDSKEYRIDSSFTDYLQRFENEGSARGRTFNPQANGLIIEFGNLSNGDAGLTHYETPIRIQIDKTYWDAISKTKGADWMKEDLIFHELGHGLLGRKHLNATLENGDWKSIMCGGTKVDNRSWNINYRGIRRSYYLDELFDESTPSPGFASMQLPVDTTGYAEKLFLSFDTEAKVNAGWPITEDAKHKTSIDNGRLCFQSKIDSVFMVLASTSLDVLSNFSYQLTLQYPSGNSTDQYGIIFGSVPSGSDVGTDPVEYFTVNNNQKMYMGNRTWYSFFTELTIPAIVAGSKNTLKVVKIGTMLYYFINGIYCYCSEIEVTSSGSQFGFLVPPKGTVWVDNLQISVKGSSPAIFRMQQTKQLEFSIQTTDQFKHNQVKNQ
ncbi:MAG: hypothetical protein Q8904_00275 [Bacteroidota bacterium]|nr:hypothetical protein [Bacteroidota bacterium]